MMSDGHAAPPSEDPPGEKVQPERMLLLVTLRAPMRWWLVAIGLAVGTNVVVWLRLTGVI